MLQVSGSGEGAEADVPTADELRTPEAPEEHPVRAMRAAANAAPYRAAGLGLDWIMMISLSPYSCHFHAAGPCRSRKKPAEEG
ncbi:hypothetical protein GCM10023085_24880 [Actinomadura viridis]